jgi:hypothetical protein
VVLSCQLRASGMYADAECALSPSQAQDGACRRLSAHSAYSGAMNPRVRRLIVSGVLGGLVLMVVVTAAWNWLR